MKKVEVPSGTSHSSHLVALIDIGMTIVCDDDGKFQIVHWPPLPVEDSVAILQISEVRLTDFRSTAVSVRVCLNSRRQRLPWRRFSIEPFTLDVNADLR